MAGDDIAGDENLAGTDIAGDEVLAGSDMAGDETLAGTDMAGIETFAGTDLAGDEILAGSDMAGIETFAGTDLAGDETLAGSDMAGEFVDDSSCNELGDTVCIDRIDCPAQTANDFFEEAEMQMICLRINAVKDATVSLDYEVNVFSQFPQNISYVLDGSVIHSNSDSELPVKGGQYFNSSQDLFLSAGTHTFRLVHKTNGELDESLPINSSDTVKSVLNIANSSYTFEDIYSTFEDRAYVTVFDEDGIQKAEITNGDNSSTLLYMLLIIRSFEDFEFNYKYTVNGVEQNFVESVEFGVNVVRIPQFNQGEKTVLSFDIPQQAFYIQINPTNSYIGFDDYINSEFGYYGNPIKLIWDSLAE